MYSSEIWVKLFITKMMSTLLFYATPLRTIVKDALPHIANLIDIKVNKIKHVDNGKSNVFISTCRTWKLNHYLSGNSHGNGKEFPNLPKCDLVSIKSPNPLNNPPKNIDKLWTATKSVFVSRADQLTDHDPKGRLCTTVNVRSWEPYTIREAEYAAISKNFAAVYWQIFNHFSIVLWGTLTIIYSPSSWTDERSTYLDSQSYNLHPLWQDQITCWHGLLFRMEVISSL